MKTELDEQLCKKYPKIFRDRHADMRITCMCWGLDCGDGWYSLIDTLCHQIQSHIDSRNHAFKKDNQFNTMIDNLRVGDTTLFDKLFPVIPKFNKNATEEQIKEHTEWRKNFTEQQREDFLKNDTCYRKIKSEVHQVVAAQVKEKFGGLRFYVDGGDDEIYAMISFAEAMSYRMCEECGSPGTTGGRGWIRTLCSAHITDSEREFFNKEPTVYELIPDEDEE